MPRIDHGWRLLETEAYEALTMAEKERYMRIQANVYRTKAGHMRLDRPVPHNQGAWDKYIPLAKSCEAEATRLAKIVKKLRIKDATGQNNLTG